MERRVAPRFLIGTTAHNQHVGNIARALHEAGALEAFHTGGIDLPKSAVGRLARAAAAAVYPRLDARLARRSVPGVPPEAIATSWLWEILRLGARELGANERVVDWIWEKSELSLDARCSRLLRQKRFNAFLGVEHGALSSIRAAAALGKPSVVGFLSAHHATRAQWVDPELDRFPQVLTRATRQIMRVAPVRDARRDEEAQSAGIVHCASSFTASSLVRAGLVARENLTIVPLGCPPVDEENVLTVRFPGPLRFVWSGGVAIHKGISILFDAWKRLRPGAAAELHVYGTVTLPAEFMRLAPAGIVFHGPVGRAEIQRAYRRADALVFPTLCDGFGMVVAEAFAAGLPVITTTNAGAADLVRTGRNGFVVAPRDADALAERLEWCLDHPQDLEAMRPAALETARRWGWPQFRQELVNQLRTRLDLGWSTARTFDSGSLHEHVSPVLQANVV